MEIAAHKKGRVNFLSVLLFGLIILLSAILTHLLILRGFFGNYYYSELVPNPRNVKNVLFNAEGKIAILYPQYAENVTGESSRIKYEIKSWERLLSNAKLKFEIINDSILEFGKNSEFKIIILPESKFLSDKEIIQLKKYLNEGGSIFANGETAFYSGYGMWRGWDFMSEIFGIKFKKELSNDESFHGWMPARSSDDGSHSNLILKSGLSLTANIPSGYQFTINNFDEPIAVEVLEQRTTQAGFWFDRRGNRNFINENINNNSGIVYGTYKNGRFVWMGFKFNSIIGTGDNIYLNQLITNSIKWLSGEPFVFINDLSFKDVEIKAEKKWKRRVAVTVSNNGLAVVNYIKTEVDLNDAAFNLNLTTEIVDTKEAEFNHKIGSRIVNLLIKDLKPEESRTYFIDYDTPDV